MQFFTTFLNILFFLTIYCLAVPCSLPLRSDSLQQSIESVLYDLMIQDDDQVFEATYTKHISPEWINFNNGQEINYQAQKDMMLQYRQKYRERTMVSESYVIVLSEDKELRGMVARTCLISAVSNETGQKAMLTIDVIIDVDWDEKTNCHILAKEWSVMKIL